MQIAAIQKASSSVGAYLPVYVLPVTYELLAYKSITLLFTDSKCIIMCKPCHLFLYNSFLFLPSFSDSFLLDVVTLFWCIASFTS